MSGSYIVLRMMSQTSQCEGFRGSCWKTKGHEDANGDFRSRDRAKDRVLVVRRRDAEARTESSCPPAWVNHRTCTDTLCRITNVNIGLDDIESKLKPKLGRIFFAMWSNGCKSSHGWLVLLGIKWMRASWLSHCVDEHLVLYIVLRHKLHQSKQK